MNTHRIPKDTSKQLLLPKLQNLPKSFPVEGAVKIELIEGIPIFRASSTVRERIDVLLEKQKTLFLNAEEKLELDLYAEIDDYLSLVNRTVRNIYPYQERDDTLNPDCILGDV